MNKNTINNLLSLFLSLSNIRLPISTHYSPFQKQKQTTKTPPHIKCLIKNSKRKRLFSLITSNNKLQKMFTSKTPQYASYLCILIIQALRDWKLEIEFSWEKTNRVRYMWAFLKFTASFRVASERISCLVF